MKRRGWLVLAAVSAAIALAGFGCRAIVGSLDECTTNSGCAVGLVCRDSLCVTDQLDARCTAVGSTAPDAIEIGVLMPLTTTAGAPDQRGIYRRNAITLAFEQLNPPIRTGVRGRPLRAVVCDTAGDATIATTLGQQLIARGAPALLSASSAETLALANVTVPAGVLLVSTSATSPEITTLAASPDGVRLVWRTAPSDALQGGVLAREVASSPAAPDGGASDGGAAVDGGAPRVAVLELNNPYGQGLYGAFRAAFAGEQTAALYDRSGDIVPAVARTQAYGPDVAVIIAFPDDAIRIMEEVRKRPPLPNARVFFTDSAKSPDLIAGLRQGALNGAHGVAPATAPPTSDAYGWLVQQLSQKDGENPSDVSFTSNAFDAAMLLAVAAQVATAPGSTLDGVHMAKALGHVSYAAGRVIPLEPEHFSEAASELAAGRDINVEGASGHLDFDPAVGEAPAAVEVWSIVDGGFVTDKVVSP